MSLTDEQVQHILELIDAEIAQPTDYGPYRSGLRVARSNIVKVMEES